MKKEISEQKGYCCLHQIFDFQTDAFGTLEIELDGRFAENVEVCIGEMEKDGKLFHEPGFKTFLHHIFRLENGHHLYRFPIPTHIPACAGFPHCTAPKEANGEVAPFRYVEINRYYGEVTVRRIAWFNDWEDTASAFSCDNPKLNKLWEFCKYSIKATSVFDRYVDGERERMPYEGDAYINQLGHFCSDANFALAKNTLRHFLTSGKFTWPTEWHLITPRLVQDYILYSGDTSIQKEWLPILEEKLLPQFMNEDGLLSPAQFQHFTESFQRDDNNDIIRPLIRDIVDWPLTERDGYEQKDVNLVPNAYLYAAFKTMSDLTGNQGYLKKASALRNAIRKHLMKDGIFVDSIGSSHTALHTAMFALLSGVADPDEIPNLKRIIQERGMACSVFGAQFLLEACYENGMADYALKLMLDEGPRGWFNMLREGATITMESWGDKWKPNQDWNHAWGAAPANIIPRYLCGIRPTAPGFEHFVVAPKPGPLSWFNCVQPTVHGPIEVKWTNKQSLEFNVPEGTEATYDGTAYPPGKYRISL